MITTVTFNPAVDKTIRLRDFQIGKLNRVDETKMDPGGKGINVARMIRNLGDKPVALSVLGGTTGKYIEEILTQEGVICDIVWSPRVTRTNLKVLDSLSGIVTEINTPGVIDEDDLDQFILLIENWAQRSGILVLSGSLPVGVPQDIYHRLISMLQKTGVKVILDAAGESLLQGLQAAPYLIKPNRFEAEQIIGYQLKTESDICDAVNYFLNQGVEIVVISLDNEGSIVGNRLGIWKVKSPQVKVCETVGAGDTLVAGMAYQIARQTDLIEMIRFATALAANYVSHSRGQKMQMSKITALLRQVEISQIAK